MCEISLKIPRQTMIHQRKNTGNNTDSYLPSSEASKYIKQHLTKL